jgi:hypothetical protein
VYLQHLYLLWLLQHLLDLPHLFLPQHPYLLWHLQHLLDLPLPWHLLHLQHLLDQQHLLYLHFSPIMCCLVCFEFWHK